MLSEAFFGCQRHKNIVDYTIFTRGQYHKIVKNWPKNRPKNAQQGPPKRPANFTLFSPTPNPKKRENPSRLKDFRGGSAAPARPRVAKAMLSNHHRTASPDFQFNVNVINRATALVPPTPLYAGHGSGKKGTWRQNTKISLMYMYVCMCVCVNMYVYIYINK